MCAYQVETCNPLQVALHAIRLPAVWQAGEGAFCEGGPLAFTERVQDG